MFDQRKCLFRQQKLNSLCFLLHNIVAHGNFIASLLGQPASSSNWHVVESYSMWRLLAFI